jgi:hypothetical protein
VVKVQKNIKDTKVVDIMEVKDITVEAMETVIVMDVPMVVAMEMVTEDLEDPTMVEVEMK